jgi:acyl-CoA synthetase (AMP-forming)/AMP-acid ligase II
LQIVEIGVSSDPATAFVVNVSRRAAPMSADTPRPDDLALLMSTSGTTGRAKIVPVSQQDLLASMFRQVGAIAVTHVDRCLCVAPLFTTSGIRRNLLNMIVVGGSFVCVSEFRAADFIDWIREFCPTFYAAGPAIHLALLEAHERGGPIGRARSGSSCRVRRRCRSTSSASPSAARRASNPGAGHVRGGTRQAIRSRQAIGARARSVCRGLDVVIR